MSSELLNLRLLIRNRSENIMIIKISKTYLGKIDVNLCK